MHSQSSSEWYTPSEYVDAARLVMGGLELDPASCDEANVNVKAERYFDEETNGLIQPWKAKSVWLNPPGSDKRGVSGTEIWLDKLMTEYENGHTLQAVVLLFRVATETHWFQSIYGRYPICFPDKRIRFIAPAGIYEEPKSQPPHGNAFVYIGPRMLEFSRVFAQYGPVMPPFLRVPTYSIERIFYKR